MQKIIAFLKEQIETRMPGMLEKIDSTRYLQLLDVEKNNNTQQTLESIETKLNSYYENIYNFKSSYTDLISQRNVAIEEKNVLEAASNQQINKYDIQLQDISK